MKGDELFLQNSGTAPDLPMIIVSGYPLGVEDSVFLQKHGVTWLKKPVAAKLLLNTVRESLEKAKV